MISLSRDTLLGGQLVLWQPARGEGYRFNLDPIFLAGFLGRWDTVIDLGAGCGVLGLYLLKTGRAKNVVAVERIPEMADIIRKNVIENGLEGRVEVVCSDLRNLEIEERGAVVFNPPYFRANQGRPAKNALRDAARFERHGGLGDFVRAAARVASQDHEVAAIVPEARDNELVACFEREGLSITRRRAVLTRAGDEPVLTMMAAASRSAGEVSVMDPLVIHAEPQGRAFSAEVNALVEPSA